MIVAKEIVARYPKKKSALIPLVHLSQEQNGYVTEDAMRHIAELIECTPAEVYGTASFYEMFRFEPTGKYLINICGTMSCALLGAQSLMHHAEETLGIKAGLDDGRRPDHPAACGVPGGVHRGADAAGELSPPLPRHQRDFDELVDQLRSGALDGEIPPHGTLARNRQQIPADKAVGAAASRRRHRRTRVDRVSTS